MKRFRPVLADVVIATIVVVLLDVLAFHFGLYFPLLEPDSYSGHVEQSSRRFQVALAQRTKPHVVLMGDSTTGAGMQERVIEEELRALGVEAPVINLAQGGSTSRSWYLLLAHESIDRTSTRLVVVGIQPFSLVVFDDPKPDISIVKTRLAVEESWRLATTYSGLERRLSIWFAGWFRAPLFREDLRSLLGDPGARFESVRQNGREERRFRTGWRRETQSTATLVSARLDAEGQLVMSALEPPIAGDPALQTGVARGLARVREHRVRKKFSIDPLKARPLRWLVEEMTSRGIPVVFAVVPLTPYPFANREIDDLEALVEELEDDGFDVDLFNPEALFDRLESPQYFLDLLHMNAVGAGIYSSALAEFLAPRLVDHPTPPSELEVEEGLGLGRGQQDHEPEPDDQNRGP